MFDAGKLVYSGHGGGGFARGIQVGCDSMAIGFVNDQGAAEEAVWDLCADPPTLDECLARAQVGGITIAWEVNPYLSSSVRQ